MEHNAETSKGTATPPKTVVVKYGYLGFVGEFEYTGQTTLIPSQPVLVETERGIELGRVLCYSCEVESGLFVLPKQVDRYIEQSGPEYLIRHAGKMVRPATAQDMMEEKRMQSDSAAKKRYCMETAERLGLKMTVVCVEHIFGGERIIFYFTAEGRVDFREMVRELAHEYQTRIELRQIGARDEARLLADYEICGRECCCKNCLKTLRPVNMKMAKLQKATLDPSKVSGRCGRLRCCLRFEQKTYEELIARLPNIGSWVETPQGVGKVKDRHVLTQLVQVMFADRMVTFPLEEISPAQAPENGLEPSKKEAPKAESRMNDSQTFLSEAQKGLSEEEFPQEKDIADAVDDAVGHDKAQVRREGRGPQRSGQSNRANETSEGNKSPGVEGEKTGNRRRRNRRRKKKK
ncbi:MAG: signal peptidase [Phycisphaerae bacterium]|jgi:cell fate regulator YaaT (PSP1 superfamily)|nr:signal peptidase [Phycisphaerae bacterium]